MDTILVGSSHAAATRQRWSAAGQLSEVERIARAYVRRAANPRRIDADDLRQAAELARLECTGGYTDCWRAMRAAAARSVYFQRARPAAGLELAADRRTDTGLALDVSDAIAHLPEREALVTRRVMAGDGQAEISAALGVSQPIVARLWRRAAARLSARLADYR